MITSVAVDGYQSIDKQKVELGPITVITGPSNTGKSALFRAINAVIINQGGDSFIKQGQTKATVDIELNSGLHVEWSKAAKSGGTYRLIAEGKAQEYTKTGGKVPEEISDALGIKAIEIDGVKLTPQISTQMSLPFLLAESGQQAAKVIASVTNMDVIFSALTACNKDVRRLHGERKSKIATLEKNMETAESLEQRLHEDQEKFDKLDTAIRNLTSEVDEVIKAYSLVDRMDEYKAQLGRIKVSDVSYLAALREEALSLIDLEKKVKDLDQTVDTLIEAESLASLVTKQLEEKRKYLNDNFKICPTCGQEVEGWDV